MIRSPQIKAQTKKHCSLTHSFILGCFCTFPHPKLVSDATLVVGTHLSTWWEFQPNLVCSTLNNSQKEEPYPCCWVWYTLKLVNRKWTCFWKPFMKALMESNVEADKISHVTSCTHTWNENRLSYTLHFRVCYITKCDHF